MGYRTTTWDTALRAHLRDLELQTSAATATGTGTGRRCVVWTGDLNVAHRDCDVMDPKKKRNKSPGFHDSERENFGLVVGGDGPITDEARQKRTMLVGRPRPRLE